MLEYRKDTDSDDNLMLLDMFTVLFLKTSTAEFAHYKIEPVV